MDYVYELDLHRLVQIDLAYQYLACIDLVCIIPFSDDQVHVDLVCVDAVSVDLV